MNRHRTSFLIVLMIGAAIIVLMIRKTGPETREEMISTGKVSDRNLSDSVHHRDRASVSTQNSRPESPASKREARVIASEGKGIMLKVHSDGTFHLSLSESAGDILVPVGKEFFRTFSSTNPVPEGVLIKIRNGRGEILTAQQGGDGWYNPAMSGGSFTSDHEERELLKASQRSADFKLSGLIQHPPRNLKNQHDLEFKLAVRSFMHFLSRDANGEPLAPEMFPDYETDWLDGALLFEGE